MKPAHIKIVVFLACLLPLLWLGYGAMSGGLGPTP